MAEVGPPDPGYDSPDGFEGFSNPDGQQITPTPQQLLPNSPELEVPFRNLDTGEVLTLSQIADKLPVYPLSARPAARPEYPATALSEEVVCCGYLWKRGHTLGQLTRRWYVLQPAVGFYYYSSAQESVHIPESRRLVDLHGARVVCPPEAIHSVLVGTPLFGMTLQYTDGAPDERLPSGGRERSREFYAEHPEEQTLWGKALTAHLADVAALIGGGGAATPRPIDGAGSAAAAGGSPPPIWSGRSTSSCGSSCGQDGASRASGSLLARDSSGGASSAELPRAVWPSLPRAEPAPRGSSTSSSVTPRDSSDSRNGSRKGSRNGSVSTVSVPTLPRVDASVPRASSAPAVAEPTANAAADDLPAPTDAAAAAGTAARENGKPPRVAGGGGHQRNGSSGGGHHRSGSSGGGGGLLSSLFGAGGRSAALALARSCAGQPVAPEEDHQNKSAQLDQHGFVLSVAQVRP